jgi:diguanylate cyclase (GGDEF)-like protein
MNNRTQKISTEQAGLILDQVPSGILVVDQEFKILWFNHWIETRIQLDSTDVIGRLLGEVFPEINRRNLVQALELVIHGGLPLTLSNRIHRYFIQMPPDDPTLGLVDMPQSAVITPLYQESQLSGLAIMISDVTERVIAEQKLKREVNKLNVLHQIDQALATLDIQACLDEIKTQTQRLFETENVHFCLVENEGSNSFRELTQRELPEELVTRVVLQGEPLLIRDTTQHDLYRAGPPEHSSEITAPLNIGTECIGLLTVRAAEKFTYIRDDLVLLEEVANRAAQAIHNARLHEQEQKQRRLAEALSEISRSLASELELSNVLDRILETISTVVPYDSASFLMKEAGIVRVRKHRGFEQFGLIQQVENSIWKLEEMPILRQVFETHQVVLVEDTHDAPGWLVLPESGHVRSWAGVPIVMRGELLGILSLDKAESGFYHQDHIAPLTAFAAHAGIALYNARVYARQVELANLDGLTGLPNRRFFDMRLAEEMQRTIRYGHPTSLIMLDIDHFRQFNDNYGHLMGDDVLKKMAHILRAGVRLIDLAARYGGEEFIIILPETTPQDALIVAERLRRSVQSAVFDAQLCEPVTISLGVAGVPMHAKTPLEFIQKTDEALYIAKHNGRNQVVLYELQVA